MWDRGRGRWFRAADLDRSRRAEIRGRRQVAEEAADVLFCLLNFCARAEIDLDEAFERMVEKAERKYPADRVRGKALKYNEYDEWSPTADAHGADEG